VAVLADHPSTAERVAAGKAARAVAPRSSHADYDPPADRADPLELLESQAKTRVPELVPIRYGRMVVSPFTFYRGAAAIMAQDLAGGPASGFEVQNCGDAHLSNFGVFASPERRLVFDINDFDETLPAPWEWDVKRLATSLLIAARDNGYRPADQDRAVLETVAQYRTAMRAFAAMGNLDVWYSHLDIEEVLRAHAREYGPRMVKRTARALARARTRDSMSALSKLTVVIDGRTVIADESPLVVPSRILVEAGAEDAEFAELQRLMGHYRDTLALERRRLLERYELVDFGRKVVGVGSVGTRTWIALLFGRDLEDPLFIQVKEAEPSVLEPLAGKSEYAQHGERVVHGQRLMQASSDIFLGWVRVAHGRDGRPHDFYCRQLRDWKASAEIDQMLPEGMAVYGRLCGWTLARAHARSGDRIAIAAYLGSGPAFDRAILGFARSYAEQNERDYARLATAVKTAEIKAELGL